MPPNDPRPIRPEDIPEGGDLLIAAEGDVVMIGVKRGGMLVSEPIWVKMTLWQAFATLNGFCSAFASDQLNRQIALKNGIAKSNLHSM
jgi:hypothetical protein